MDLSLEQRLTRFLGREEEDERRSSEDLRALSVEERVLEGECIQGARFVGTQGDAFLFEVAENVSKFRVGDTLYLGDGLDFDGAIPLAYGGYDAGAQRLVLRRNRFARQVVVELDEAMTYCVDRRAIDARGRLRDVVSAGFQDEAIAATLEGTRALDHDADRLERATAVLTERGLNPSQVRAGAGAVAANQLALVQGPPGTGKTRVLAEILSMLCGAGCRIALSGFTHRAVDNVLLGLRKIDPQVELIKLGYPREGDQALRAARVRFVDPRQGQQLPAKGVVVAGTSFAFAKLPAERMFHYTVFDEAGQLPIPHAIAGMLLSQRWLFFGDHRQLPPVIKAYHADVEVTRSVFEHLAAHYDSDLLDESYRMNAAICQVISETFYEGRLRSAAPAAGRTVPHQAGGALDEVLSPEHSAVLARVDHLQPGKRSPEEAELIADLVVELLQRHGVPQTEIAVVAPFRAQVRAIRSAFDRRSIQHDAIMVDTVERMQGQEREVILVSLAVGDAHTLDARASFFFSTHRLNVALSRARTKVVLVASRGAFRALPTDTEALRAACVFKQLFATLPQVDLTAVYAARGLAAAP